MKTLYIRQPISSRHILPTLLLVLLAELLGDLSLEGVEFPFVHLGLLGMFLVAIVAFYMGLVANGAGIRESKFGHTIYFRIFSKYGFVWAHFWFVGRVFMLAGVESLCIVFLVQRLTSFQFQESNMGVFSFVLIPICLLAHCLPEFIRRKPSELIKIVDEY